MGSRASEHTDGNGPGKVRWVIATPYFVQTTSTLTEVPTLYFIKNALAVGDAGGQLFDALRQAGWFVKPVWGFISDIVASDRRTLILRLFVAIGLLFT